MPWIHSDAVSSISARDFGGDAFGSIVKAAEPIETVGNNDLNARVEVLSILLAARVDALRVDDEVLSLAGLTLLSNEAQAEVKTPWNLKTSLQHSDTDSGSTVSENMYQTSTAHVNHTGPILKSSVLGEIPPNAVDVFWLD
eukprot:4321793-Amphidinium_carterae.1